MVHDCLDRVLRCLQASDPEWFQRATAVNIDLDVLALRIGVVVDECGAGERVASHVTDRTQVSPVAAVAGECQVILFAHTTVLAWIRVASVRTRLDSTRRAANKPVDHLARLDGYVVLLNLVNVLCWNILRIHKSILNVDPSHTANESRVGLNSTANRVLLSGLHLERTDRGTRDSIQTDDNFILLQCDLHIVPRAVVELPVEWLQTDSWSLVSGFRFYALDFHGDFSLIHVQLHRIKVG